MLPVFDHLNLRDADRVIDLFTRGAAASFSAACRHGSIDLIGPFASKATHGSDPPSGSQERQGAGARLIATGDLHDNPLHLARVVQAAGLADPGAEVARSHLTLHELIHSDNTVNHTDFSYRVLARAAALKIAYPELVHVLLANHELAQLTGAEVVKEGTRCVAAFDAGLEVTFSDRAEEVREAVRTFIASMPLALRVRLPSDGRSRATDLLCAHSVPSPHQWNGFDRGVFDRSLGPEDYLARTGACHQCVWGRGLDDLNVAQACELLGVRAVILGHEKAESGYITLGAQGLILNSDHERGAFLDLDLTRPWLMEAVLTGVRSITTHRATEE